MTDSSLCECDERTARGFRGPSELYPQTRQDILLRFRGRPFDEGKVKVIRGLTKLSERKEQFTGVV